MNFMQWLNSLDELLYEVVSWMVFFPVTLWKAIRHPLAIMHYAETELRKDESEQYQATLSPPIFLILAIVVSHGLEIAAGGGANPIVRSHHGLAGLVNDNTSLLLLRIVIFGTFPLILATRMTRKTQTLTRNSLQPAFYAQCFVAAPFALGVNIGGTMTQLHLPSLRIAGWLLIALSLLLYGSLQAAWFTQKLARSPLRGFADASIGMVESLMIALSFGYLFVL